MYEPIYVPKLDRTLLGLHAVRLGNTHFKGVRTPEHPIPDPLHIHDCTELFFCVKGNVSFLVDERVYPVEEGEAILFRPNQVHMCLFEKTTEYEFDCLWIDPGELAETFRLSKTELSSPVLSFPQKISEELADLFTHLSDDADPLERTASLLRIFLLLKKKNESSSSEYPMPVAFRNILEDINRRFCDLNTLSELCAEHFVSPATLNRWFRRYLQITPHEYIESKRLSYAFERLCAGASVSDACVAAGFSDCSHFITLFRRKFGKTPLQFKKNGT